MFKKLKKLIAFKAALFTTLGGALILFIALISFGQISDGDISKRDLISLISFGGVSFLIIQFLLVVSSVNIFITRPLRKIYETMKSVDEGNINAQCNYNEPDEFGDMAQKFNKMILRLNEIISSRKRIEQKLMQTEESLKYKKELEAKSKIIERMNNELTESFNQVALLYTTSQLLTSSLDQKELIKAIKQIFTDHFKCDQFAFFSYNADKHQLFLETSRNIPELKDQNHLIIYPENGITGHTAEFKRPYYYENIKSPLEVDIELSGFEKQLCGSVYSIPLISNQQLLGTIIIAKEDKKGFSAPIRNSLTSIGNQIAASLLRSQLYIKTKELSVTDELTGVFNRRHFVKTLNMEMKRAERYKRHISLLVIDVDHFKKLNDTYGHLVGDEVLKKLAQLIQHNTREVDIFARYGGEEFVLMLTDTNMKDATKVGNKIRELVKLSLNVGKIPEDLPSPKPTVSIGIATYPECADSPTDLFKAADTALYMAKREGRDRVFAYEIEKYPLEKFMKKEQIIH